MSNLAAFFRVFWALAKPYFTRSEERLQANILLGVIVALNLASVGLNVWFNYWYNNFYNALQEKDFDSFKSLLLYFTLVAIAFIIVAVYRQYLQQMLQIRWRRWLTETWVADWLADKHYYHMQMLGLGTDNPDQRLSEDLRLFPAASLSLVLGLMNSVVTLVSFLGILWTLSGALSFTLGGMDISIPGYMVWVAFVYAAGGTWLTWRIGRPLVKLNFEKQQREADFRFHLVRIRENAEGIAFLDGEAVERAGLSDRFRAVFGNFYDIMRRQKQLTWFTSAYGQLAVIFPFVVASPRYFSGAIQLGGLMQISSAFGQVQGSLSFIVDAYTEIAEWQAIIQRLDGFAAGLRKARETVAGGGIAVEATDNGHVAAHALAVALPDGRPLLTVDRLDLAPGDSLLIRGRSGRGKSTLFRALAGLWPFGKGRIARPGNGAAMFLPQRPYLPVDTLRAALAYPDPVAVYPDARYGAALEALGLHALAGRLDESANWTQILSGGEQQRVQLARALLKCPDWLFLDEATSALDEASEASALEALRTALPQTTIVSIGHRPALQAFHKAQLDLDLPAAAAAE